MASADFLSVLDIIFNDDGLQAGLRTIRTSDDFVAAVMEIARSNGLAFDANEIAELINLNRRSWHERHIA